MTEAREQTRWVEMLGSALLLASMSMAIVFATHIAWFMIGALIFGPGATVLALVFLILSTDSNTPADVDRR